MKILSIFVAFSEKVNFNVQPFLKVHIFGAVCFEKLVKFSNLSEFYIDKEKRTAANPNCLLKEISFLSIK